MPSVKSLPMFISSATNSVWLMLLALSSLKCMPFSRSLSAISRMLLILATVTTAYRPRWELTMMGCGSVSLITPNPVLPKNESSSSSNFERK